MLQIDLIPETEQEQQQHCLPSHLAWVENTGSKNLDGQSKGCRDRLHGKIQGKAINKEREPKHVTEKRE